MQGIHIMASGRSERYLELLLDIKVTYKRPIIGEKLGLIY